MSELITPERLALLAKNTPLDRLRSISAALVSVCPQYKMYDADILQEFIATLLEESHEFRSYSENLSYQPGRLCVVWPSRFPSLEAAKPYANNPKALAEKVYGFRKDLGNTEPDDGWLFRGSGPIQCTGRGIITAFCSYVKKTFGTLKSPEEMVILIRTDDTYAIHSACWVFAVAKKLIDEAIDDKMITIVEKINGGRTNLSQRLKYYDECKKIIV